VAAGNHAIAFDHGIADVDKFATPRQRIAAAFADDRSPELTVDCLTI
jgi:hypothetical protein